MLTSLKRQTPETSTESVIAGRNEGRGGRWSSNGRSACKMGVTLPLLVGLPLPSPAAVAWVEPPASSTEASPQIPAHLLLALVIIPLTTHPFRDRAPFILLIETPSTFGRLLRLFLSHSTIDHTSLPRRSTLPFNDRVSSNIWTLIALLPYTT